MKLVFATRPSALARYQTEWVINALQRAWPDLECLENQIVTQGDRILDRPLPEIGGKGLFTQELEAELVSGCVQAAVHSLKDLPVENPPGLILGAIPPRADARDVLVCPAEYTLDQLPSGARVGTSSLRRLAQLLAHRPDLQVLPLRGNVDTRLRKVQEGQYDAIVLAGAGLTRLGLDASITQWLPFEVMLPAPGQGALAVQCRSDDPQSLEYLAVLEDTATRMTVSAERAFLTALGGGCSLPIAAYAVMDQDGVGLDGLVAAPDGSVIYRGQSVGNDPFLVGAELAQDLLAQGAGGYLHG
jgi:hydroxymethylbilane synthase